MAGYGPVTGDIAWGGNWFFLIGESPLPIDKQNLEALTAFTWAVRQTLEQAGICGEDGGAIDHIELFGDDPQADSRSFVLCPGKAYDRSRAAPAPVPNWRVWQRKASCRRTRSGGRPA